MSNRFPEVRTKVGLLPRLIALLLVLVCIGSAIGVESALGQAFEYKPELKKSKFEVDQLLRSGTEIPIRQQDLFDNFFNFYILPPMAMREKSADLPQVRNEIRKYFLTGKIGAPYNKLNELVQKYMEAILENIKSPVARYNAVLVIGDLNAFEGGTDEKGGGKYSQPLPSALEFLVNLLKDPKQPDYIRVAAMVGMKRHAQYASIFPLESATKVEVTTAMLELLRQKEIPKGRTLAGHAYLRRSAGEILASLGDVGKNGVNFSSVVAAIDDPDSPMSLRLGLCSALEQFKIEAGSKLDLLQAAGAVGRAAADAAQLELNRAEFLSTQSDKPVDPDRRRMCYIFRQAQLGLTGPRGVSGIADAAEGTPNGSTIASIGERVSTILKELEGAAFIDSVEFAPKLADLQQALPKRADTGKVPAGVAKKAGPVSSAKKVPAVPANR